MAEVTVACILNEGSDMEARIARMCEAVMWIGCACGRCVDHPGHGVALSCCKARHGDDELHRDLDGIEWREVTAA